MYVSVQFTVDCRTVLTCSTVTVPGQASLAVTSVVFGAGIDALHESASVAGQVIVGGVTSILRVIVCVHVALLPHSSVALYVLIYVSVQFTVDCSTVLTCSTVTVPGQASLAVTSAVFGAGIVLLQESASVAGQRTVTLVTYTLLFLS